MKSARYLLCMFLVIATLPSLLIAQQRTTTSSTIVPQLVNYSGKATDGQGKPISGITGITFSIYKEQDGGAALWMETQNVTADTKGNYIVQLGASKSEGLPLDLFASGEARWLGVRINGGEEQPRVLLLSVPYALKAADAQTLGGLPASAFLKTSDSKSATAASTAAPPAGTITGSGSANRVAKFVGSTQIGNSDIFDGSGKVGVGTSTPTAKLDVAGSARVRGTTELDGAVSAGAITASAGVTGMSASATNAGVNGQNAQGGIGVLGQATGTTGQGLWGESFATDSANGVGPDGVHGVNHSSQGAGVAGLSVVSKGVPGLGVYGQGSTGVYGAAATIVGTGVAGQSSFGVGVSGSSSSGTGVYGSGATGISGSGTTGVYGTGTNFAFQSTGNASQDRASGGWVKAMVAFNGSVAPYSVRRCFNSTLAGAAATTPPCGFNFTEVQAGWFELDFGFEVDDRFLAVSQQCCFSYGIAPIYTDQGGNVLDIFTWDGGNTIPFDATVVVF